LNKFWLSLMSLWATVVFAGPGDLYQFASPAASARFEALTGELRCLVCQNQSLADSDAPLAKDLRHKVYELMQSGQSDVQIKAYLVHRYGAFILFNPPVNRVTWLLWGFPGLLGVGISTWILVFRRRL
jgi:cytochrome c-type biogenesis protein CcmH